MSKSQNKFVRYLTRFGAGSMAISIIVHVIILGSATVWVVSSSMPQRKPSFQGGGNNSSAPAVQHAVKMSNTQPNLAALTQRLVVENASSSVTLPDLPAAVNSGPANASPGGLSGGPGVGQGAGIGNLKAPIMPLFGFKEAPSAGTLVGRFYDLKQNPQHKPTGMSLLSYGKVVDEFLSEQWNSSVLSRYYQVPQSIYTTQIFIPLLPAEEGPKAFGQEKLIEPKFWLIRYKGKVAAPSNGSWRFWGYGGEVCCVRINGKTVLVSNHEDVKTPKTRWKSPEPTGQHAGSGQLVAGEWIDLRAGQFVDIDILIGERGGGTFDCFLLIEKKGDTYGKTKEGHPILPVFQLASNATRTAKDAPLFLEEGPIWRSLPVPKN
ncbi:MAG: hypothetical protein H7Y06_01195 [Opitutaceae bacterium]|nr:hypothetical protein [Opitutaceae bacterium]